MDFELRIIAGCPHAASAGRLFAQALELEGNGQTTPRTREIDTDANAESLDFHGSPTFTLNGVDLFPSNAGPAVTCRVYPSAQGLSGLPTLDSLRDAVRTALFRRDRTV